MQFWFGMFFLFVTPFVGLWAFSDLLPFASEVTVFETICHGVRKDGDCQGKEEPLTKTTYKPMTDQQIVLAWGDDSAPVRLNNCAVRDGRNWACDGILGSRSQMIDGRYHRISGDWSSSPSDSVFQVTKWYWWWLKLDSKAEPNRQKK